MAVFSSLHQSSYILERIFHLFCQFTIARETSVFNHTFYFYGSDFQVCLKNNICEFLQFND